MVTLSNKLSNLGQATPSNVNAALSEIQAYLNSISIVRGTLTEPKSDYFRFDTDAGKMYLVTIEGDEHEVQLV